MSDYEISKDALKRFFGFIKERHAIYIRRNRGDEWPWTDDKILQTYKFTNIFRELDTGTVHCRTAIREPYADDRELFFNIATYRLYNYIDTQREIGYIYHYDPERVMNLMYIRRNRGDRIFTGAHMITGTLGGDKIWQVFGLCFGKLWEQRRELEPKPGDTLEKAFNRLNKHNPGYGPFIAYEVITDLRWTRYLDDADDIMTWANPGPGCMRGINRLLGNPVYNKKDYNVKKDTKRYPDREGYLDIMRYLLRASSNMTYLPKWISALEMRDIEHSLCEFDKYERVRLGEGRPRSLYNPPIVQV
jgi:hypothetical protein